MQFFVVIENCTCVGVNNEWGEGSECKIYSGYPQEFLNSKWCYAETTSCADAASLEYDPAIHPDNGRFGPSQTSCFKGTGNIISENSSFEHLRIFI